jgi:hypothetical protein
MRGAAFAALQYTGEHICSAPASPIAELARVATLRERSQSAPEDTSCPAVGDAQIGDNEDGGGMNKEDAKKDKKKTKKRSILSPARKDAISKVG